MAESEELDEVQVQVEVQVEAETRRERVLDDRPACYFDQRPPDDDLPKSKEA